MSDATAGLAVLDGDTAVGPAPLPAGQGSVRRRSHLPPAGGAGGEWSDPAHLRHRYAGAVRDLIDARSAGYARVHEALGALDVAGSAVALVAAVPDAVLAACGFDRALLTTVEGSSWWPGRGQASTGASLPVWPGGPIALRAGLLEAECVRRRTAALAVDAHHDPRAHQQFVAVAELTSYVVVPVLFDDRVVALLHATLAPGGRALSVLDRDLAMAFAAGVTRAYEHVVHRQRVSDQRQRLRHALGALDVTPRGVDSHHLQLMRSPAPGAPSQASAAHTEHDLLTTRESEVLALLASGATNLQIAARLVVSESTVKSHVKRILRKLGATNRAEAVALHLRTAPRRPA